MARGDAATDRRSAAQAGGDGRLLRSARSRQAIVDAMLALVGEGVRSPTAEQVATRAGVGIRTVFRHFQDMEGLFAAMDARLEAQVLPLLGAPVEGDLAARAEAFARQRARLFEAVAPYKRAEALKRWRSPFLRARHASMTRRLRDEQRRWFPELATTPPEAVEAAELAASFEAWDRLRSEQRLGRGRAAAVLAHILVTLLAPRPAGR